MESVATGNYRSYSRWMSYRYNALAEALRRRAEHPTPVLVLSAQRDGQPVARSPRRAAPVRGAARRPATYWSVGSGGSVVETAAQVLVEEAAINDGERLVARRAGRRWVRRFERLALPPADAISLPLKPRGVYLITGGTGGIGLTLARWLAAQVSARLVLTTRTAFPSRGEWDAWLAEHGSDDRTATAIRAIRDLEGPGSEVVVAAADAADPVAMQRNWSTVYCEPWFIRSPTPSAIFGVYCPWVRRTSWRIGSNAAQRSPIFATCQPTMSSTL